MLVTLKRIFKNWQFVQISQTSIILFDRIFLADENYFLSISNYFFCLKLCNLLYLHLQCNMAYLHCATFTLCTCVLCSNRFRFRILPSLTLHNCLSNHICQICKINRLPFPQVYALPQLYAGILQKIRNSRKSNQKEDSLTFSQLWSYWGLLKYCKM